MDLMTRVNAAKGTLTILWHYLLTKYIRRFVDIASVFAQENRRNRLLIWQDRQVRNLLAKILPKSKFYRDYYQGLDIREWRQFPTIDKSIMMANFDDLNTVGISKDAAFELAIAAETTRNFSSTLDGYTIGLSSGTSGNRGLFIVSQQEQQAWAGTILAKALPKSILTPQRIVFFLRANSNLYETVSGKRIEFNYFDLFEPIESHIDRLNQIAPNIIVAPPSMLRLLADARSNGDLNIIPTDIFSVAEVLDPLDERYIRDRFNCTIHQIYQCTEGFLGSTCKYGTLHLNEDILVIQKEYIDRAAGKFIPIVTDFNRRTQPIIRYRLNDILTELPTPCPCGSIFTALARIEGREDDIFWLLAQAGEKSIPIFPDFIRRAIIIASNDIQEYRAVQKSFDSIEIHLKVPADLEKSIKEHVDRSLRDLFTRSHCQIPQIDYQPYLVRTNLHQKLRRIQREFNPNSQL
jgi:putative adenylate-forming enzyme